MKINMENNFKTYKITAIGEGIAQTTVDLTEEQYILISSIFSNLNDNGEPYSPYLSIFNSNNDEN